MDDESQTVAMHYRLLKRPAMFNNTAYSKRQLNIYRQLNIQVTLGVPAHLDPLDLGSGSISPDLGKSGPLEPVAFVSRNVSF